MSRVARTAAVTETFMDALDDPTRCTIHEILNRKRRLTLKMMRKLHEGLGIPLEILVRDYELKNGVRSE